MTECDTQFFYKQNGNYPIYLLKLVISDKFKHIYIPKELCEIIYEYYDLSSFVCPRCEENKKKLLDVLNKKTLKCKEKIFSHQIEFSLLIKNKIKMTVIIQTNWSILSKYDYYFDFDIFINMITHNIPFYMMMHDKDNNIYKNPASHFSRKNNYNSYKLVSENMLHEQYEEYDISSCEYDFINTLKKMNIYL
jgi:hypothetical protein